MKQGRIVHLTTVHHPLDPRIFWKEAVSLRAAGYEVHVVAQHTRQETIEGVAIVPLRPMKGRYRRVVLQRQAYRVARRLEAALYHIHDPELLPLAYALKRATGARIVYDMHENSFVQTGPDRYVVQRLERWAMGWVDYVVLAEVSYTGVVPPSTPHTVILNYFKPRVQRESIARTRTQAMLRLLAAGVLSRRRGLDTLLDLAALARDEGKPWHLTLAGVCYRQSDREAADHRIHREKLDEVISKAGWDTYVPWPELEPQFAAADVGLTLFEPDPNFTGSVPTKFYEYLFYGLPLLCSDVPLWRAFVERHGCGAVVPPGDARAASAMLERWATDAACYERLSAAAAEAASHYLWPAMEARLLTLYEKLLNE